MCRDRRILSYLLNCRVPVCNVFEVWVANLIIGGFDVLELSCQW